MVSLADKNLNVFSITGDGSFQFNLQELQTIKENNLPIKIIILNNGGYLCIRNTQIKYFEKRFSGVDSNSGISFPECSKIADAYGFKFFKISEFSELESTLDEVANLQEPCICEIICPESEKIYPTAASKQMPSGKLVSQPLENMFPFLPEEEFKKEMIVSICEEENEQ